MELTQRGRRRGRGWVMAAAWTMALVLALPLDGLAQGGLYEGRPAFREGWDFGYYVWRDGRTWHVRWTTRGNPRRFTGHVVAEGGRLDDLKRIDVETERRVVHPGRPARVVRGPYGRAHVAPGRAPVTATKVEDRIDMDDHRRIDFSARTDDDIDGFDFETEGDVDVLRFTLAVDGRSRAQDVEIGRGNVHPTGNPFVVRLR